ncbi:MAG: LysR family transcriptional regulator substrate-binding protein [Kiloniellales bacterium]
MPCGAAIADPRHQKTGGRTRRSVAAARTQSHTFDRTGAADPAASGANSRVGAQRTGPGRGLLSDADSALAARRHVHHWPAAPGGVFRSLPQAHPAPRVVHARSDRAAARGPASGREIDIALIGLPNFPERLAASPLYEERYVIAFRIGHRFESMNTVPIRELDGEDYLERVNCEFNDHYEAIGEPVPFAVKVRYRSEREDWVQAMILAGMGCAVMPEFLPIMPGLTTRTLMDPEMRRTIHLVTVRGRRFSPTVEAFVRLARRYDWKAA